jgi:hypothetical protein
VVTEESPSPRSPCPCGSGRRYKACHGKAAARAEHTRVLRPFAGLAGEPEWVAMREIVPAATAELRATGDHTGRAVTLCSVLPMAWPALVRKDGLVMVAAQTQTSSGDASRDLGDALRQALEAEVGSSIPPRPLPVEAPRIADLVDVTVAPRVVVHARFDFWFGATDDIDDATQGALDRADAAAMPTARLATVEAGYWMQIGDRRQLRWVLPGGEDDVIDALARMQVRGGLDVGGGSRYLGSFRALGLLIPVWDLVDGVEVDDVEEPAASFLLRLNHALAEGTPLDGGERRARESLLARQLTMH